MSDHTSIARRALFTVGAGTAAAAMLPAGTAAAAATSPMIRFVSPVGDDTNDGLTPGTALATIGTALAALPGGTGTVELLPGQYTLGPSESYELDASKVSLRSTGPAVLTWTAAPTAGYALRLIATADFTNRFKNWRKALEGIVVRGQLHSPFAAVGIRIGHDTYDSVATFGLENGGVEGFQTGLRFESNSWRVTCRNFHIRGGGIRPIEQVTTVVNAGENMMFYDCMLEGTSGVYVVSGDWHFYGCSFDNCPVIADGDADVYLHGCHVENPGDTTGGYRMLRVEDNLGKHGASLTANGTHFVLSNGGSVFGRSPFYVAGTNVEGGLTLTDCRLPQNGFFQPEVHETHRRWVAGEGRAVATGTHGNENFHGAPFSSWMNVLFNTDAEAGNTTGWVVGGGGGSFTVTSTPGTFRTGNAGFKVGVTSGQSITVHQDFAVRPGQKIAVGFWVKTAKTGGGQLSSSVKLYAYPGGPEISTVGWDNNAANPGSLRNIGAVVLPRVTVARLIFEVWASGSGTAELFFDDVIANVI